MVSLASVEMAVLCADWLCCCQVTDHATTALLHYQLPQMPDVVVRSFMVRKSWSWSWSWCTPPSLLTFPSVCLSVQTWLRSYIKLFQSSCQRCGHFLQDGLPPTWRDFRTLEAFHDTCRM